MGCLFRRIEKELANKQMEAIESFNLLTDPLSKRSFSAAGVSTLRSNMGNKMRVRSLAAACLTCLLLVGSARFAVSETPSNEAVEVTSEYTYAPLMSEPETKIRTMALFAAKMNAATVGAQLLEEKGLLPILGEKKKEILCLAADQIEVAVVEEEAISAHGGYRIRILTRIDERDFVQTETVDRELEEEEQEFSYREEMEQPVSAEISPGKELSRAYRYLRKKQWRIAIIYLDHLERKYPNCGEVYLAKAFGFSGLHQIDRMQDSLQTACLLRLQEACEDLRKLD